MALGGFDNSGVPTPRPVGSSPLGAAGYVPPSPQWKPDRQIALRVFPGPSAAQAGSQTHTLVLPFVETWQLQWPIRTTATQTIVRAYIDDFGLGVPTLQLSGHTGWHVTYGQYNGQPVDGYQAFHHLYYDIVLYYFDLEAQQGSQQPDVTCEVLNALDQLHYRVKPTQQFQVVRSKSRPLLYQWSLSFIVLEDLAAPDAFTPIPSPVDPLLPTTGGAASTPGGGSPRDPGQAPPAQAQTPPAQHYTVESGDTLWGIALKFYGNGADYPVIARANHLANPNLIFPGQVLTIPALP